MNPERLTELKRLCRNVLDDGEHAQTRLFWYVLNYPADEPPLADLMPQDYIESIDLTQPSFVSVVSASTGMSRDIAAQIEGCNVEPR